jgi:hypothetical protein
VRAGLARSALAALRTAALLLELALDRAYGLLLAAIRSLSTLRASALARRARRTSLALARTAAVAFAGALLVLGLGHALFVRIPAGTTGVRQVNFWGRGIAARDHAPGLVFSPRGLESWHFVDRRTEVLTFAWDSEAPDRPMLELRTSDGNLARLGAAVCWRVRAGEAHALVRDGAKSVYRERVRATVESVLLQEFAALSSTEILDTDVRLARAARARDVLEQRLAAVHVLPESVLITQVMFGPDYEKKLQQKQLTVQTMLLQEAATAVEKEEERIGLFQQEIETSVKTIVAAMDLRIETRFAAGRQRIAEIEAETKSYDRTRRAEGQAEHDRQLLVGERALASVEHRKQELFNKSYGTAGGRLLLARRAAENLNFRQVTLNSNDPRAPSVLDLDDLVRRLIGVAPGVACAQAE